MAYIHFHDVITIANGAISLSVDDGVTYKPMYTQARQPANLYTAPLLGIYYTVVYDILLDGWLIYSHDKSHLAMAGFGWSGETIKGTADVNDIQDIRLNNVENALATGGATIKQVTDITIPYLLTNTATKLDFDTLDSISKDDTILTTDVTAEITTGAGLSDLLLDVSIFNTEVTSPDTYEFIYDGSDWTLDAAIVLLTTYGLTVTGVPVLNDVITVIAIYDHILLNTNEYGYGITGVFSLRNLSGGVDATSILRLYSGGVLVDTLEINLLKGESRTFQKNKTAVIDPVPQTLTVTAELLTGTIELITGSLIVSTNWTTGGISPTPEEEATILVADWASGTTATTTGLTVATEDSVDWTYANETSRQLIIDHGVRAVTAMTTAGEIDWLADTTPVGDIDIIVKRMV